MDIDLRRGGHVSLADLVDALCGALRKLVRPTGPEGLFIRCTNRLTVQIRSYQDADSSLIEVRLEHRTLRNIVRNEEDVSKEPPLHRAMLYLAQRDWSLPKEVYDCPDALQDSADIKGPFSETHPTWTQERAANPWAHLLVAREITGALAVGFGMEKDDDVFLGK
jgi:hypothetical protein